jgi:hypothetical protein
MRRLACIDAVVAATAAACIAFAPAAPAHQ